MNSNASSHQKDPPSRPDIIAQLAIMISPYFPIPFKEVLGPITAEVLPHIYVYAYLPVTAGP
jgi:hypothetical protein